MIDIVSKDTRISNLIASLATTGSKLAPWANGQGTLIGAVMIFSPAQPATIDGQWRSVTWLDSAKMTYGVTIYTAKLSNVTTVNVWVDFGKGAVVGWSPNSDAKVETGPVIIATAAAP